MTEAEWMTCADPKEMLHFLVGHTTARKMGLFACACGRQVWHLLDERRQQSIEAEERYAEARSSRASAADAHRAAGAATGAAEIEREAKRRADYLAAAAQRATTGKAATPADAIQPTGSHPGQQKQAGLLREIIGNPFRATRVPESWPPAVRQLASALATGEDCGAALHGTLMALGHAELAEHFRWPGHPRGCWALDLILGKK